MNMQPVGRSGLRYLSFDSEEIADGMSSLEAMASSTTAVQHAEVMAEVQQVLDWAWHEFAHTHGAIDDGMEWDHDLQIRVEAGPWHTVSLTLTGTDRFVREFVSRFLQTDVRSADR